MTRFVGPAGIAEMLQQARESSGAIVVLTGAGISAESGIPTFRGEGGYWTVGSRVYQAQELATWAAFSTDPGLVWPWYLYRRTICRRAEPNAAHIALAEMADDLGERLILVTQNVDGLHLRAGSPPTRTWEIHGNIDFMRCARDCTDARWPVPELGEIERGAVFDEAWRAALQCPRCIRWARPHVLWFDECYDEPRYRYESALNATLDAAILIVIGTSGATSLPMRMAQVAQRRGIPIIDVNPQSNPFSRLAGPAWIAEPACRGVPWIRDVCAGDRS